MEEIPIDSYNQLKYHYANDGGKPSRVFLSPGEDQQTGVFCVQSKCYR